jgi:DNA (cytosine-5)-methyltransferase 1
VREYARIQSFEDWFVFRGNYTTGGKNRKHDVPRYTQVANAVPPFLAEAIGLALVSFIEQFPGYRLE